MCFYNDKTEEVSSHTLRLPKEGTVADLLGELQRQLGEEYGNRQLRLMEVSYSRIFKVCERAWGGVRIWVWEGGGG